MILVCKNEGPKLIFIRKIRATLNPIQPDQRGIPSQSSKIIDLEMCAMGIERNWQLGNQHMEFGGALKLVHAWKRHNYVFLRPMLGLGRHACVLVILCSLQLIHAIS